MSRPRISVCVPTHDMDDADYFLQRLQKSLEDQTFTDFEVVVTQEGKMAENTNAAIKQATGDIVKLLYMDDYLYSKDALKHIAESFDRPTHGGWYASGCVHDDGVSIGNPHTPLWNPQVPEGLNSIGSPSVIAFENDEPLLFDENMSWLLDCDLYGRLYERCGPPDFEYSYDIAIGIGPHQTTHIMSDAEKLAEHEYLTKKHGTN